METIGDKGTEESIRAAKRSSLISRDWEEWDVEMFGWKTKGWDIQASRIQAFWPHEKANTALPTVPGRVKHQRWPRLGMRNMGSGSIRSSAGCPGVGIFNNGLLTLQLTCKANRHLFSWQLLSSYQRNCHPACLTCTEWWALGLLCAAASRLAGRWGAPCDWLLQHKAMDLTKVIAVSLGHSGE